MFKNFVNNYKAYKIEDYVALMPSMLRSQNIPTRLEVGYVGEVYHAWISTYIKNIGWVNGMIEFNSKK